MNKKRAATYSRYSTKHQSDDSITDQQRRTRALCKREGWDLVEEYADSAMSGYTVCRPDLIRLLRDADAGKFDFVVVESLDRLSRELADLPEIHRRLQSARVEVYAINKGLIDKTAVAVSALTSVVTQATTTDQVHRDLMSLVSQGKFAGGRCYGYQKVLRRNADGTEAKGEREPVEEQARVVERIYREFAAGRSVDAIVNDLNAEGIPGPSGKPWRKSTIYGHRTRGTGILNNELYRGVYIWNRRKFTPKAIGVSEEMQATAGKARTSKERPREAQMRPENEYVRVPMPELRIIDEDLWEAVRERFAVLDAQLEKQQTQSGGQNRRAGIGATRRNLSVVADVLHCGECGGRMTCSTGGRMQCSTAKECGASMCTNKRNWPRQAVEERLLAALKDELMSEAALRSFMQLYNAEIDKMNAAHTRKRETIKAERAEIDSSIANVLAAVRKGFANETLMADLTGLESRKSELDAELAKPQVKPYSLHPNAAALYRQHIEALADQLEHPETGDQVRQSIRGLLERVTLTPAPDRGKKAFDLEVEGALGALLQAAGVQQKDAASIDAASQPESSGQLVAGVGFGLRSLYSANGLKGAFD